MQAHDITAQFIATFSDYPPRQKAPSFTIDQVMQNMTANVAGEED